MSVRTRLIATGIRRTGQSRVSYRTADGAKLGRDEVRRIDALRIPAAWTQVHVAPSPVARVQAVGRDAAGRWQYRYRATHLADRSRTQFEHLLAFGAALPPLRRALRRDLARRSLCREKAMACAVAVLTTCLLRPGTEIHTQHNGSFGLATLRNRHAVVEGSRIRFDFRGKHGQRQRHEVRSASLARTIAVMQRLPGSELFKYVDRHGRVRDLRSWHLNAYIKERMGAHFSARAFRTWGGTLLCAAALARRGRGATAGARRTAVADALRETAMALGNTVAACRRAYVHPGVIEAFARGEITTVPLARPEALIALGRSGLDRSERALLRLLQKQS